MLDCLVSRILAYLLQIMRLLFYFSVYSIVSNLIMGHVVKSNLITLLCSLALLIMGGVLFESVLFTKQASKIKSMNKEAQSLMLPATNPTQKQKEKTTTIYR